MGAILVVEDDKETRSGLMDLFGSTTHYLFGTGKIEEADDILDNHEIDVVLLDVELEDTIAGIDYISFIQKKNANTQVIIVTKFTDIDYVIRATKNGAFYYLTKPFNPQDVLILTEKALKISQQARKALLLETENTLLKQRLRLSESQKTHPMVSQSDDMKRIQDQLKKVVEHGLDTNILLCGESGVGKEVFARFIFEQASTRLDKEIAFIAVNCTSIPQSLFESEFFGHEKGAFTGADRLKHGYFELAEDGYIFLDEIGDMPMEFQAKLLRVLQEKQVRRLGGTKPITCNFKLITATNQNLKQKIRDGCFREDLFYRISTIDVSIPPLRKRPEDIALLTDLFITRISRRTKKAYPPIDQKTLDLLVSHDWPGNVRELKNTVEKLLVLGFDGTGYKTEVLSGLTAEHCPSHKEATAFNARSGINHTTTEFLHAIKNKESVDYRGLLTALEKEIFNEALASNENNGLKAAKQLGMSKSTFYTRLKSLS